VPEQFDADGRASVLTLFAGRKLRMSTIIRPSALGIYTIAWIRLNRERVSHESQGRAAILPRNAIMALAADADAVHTLECSWRPTRRTDSQSPSAGP